MAAMIRKLKYASKAKGTRKQYAREWARFEKWALKFDQPILPSSPLGVDLYLGHLVLDGKGVSTVRLALAAIAEKHVFNRLVDPTKDATIRMTVQGIQRVLGRPAVQARPITKGTLKGLIHKAIGKDLDSNGRVPASLVNWREAWRELASYLTLSRFSDLQRVRKEDITLNYESKIVAIAFKTRKNDQHHSGHVGYMYATNNRYCPFRLTERYLAMLPASQSGFMLFNTRTDGAPATFNACRSQQKRLLSLIGLDPRPFGLHSGRVGGAMALEDAQFGSDLIGIVGGWALGSAMPAKYAKKAMAKRRRAAAILKPGATKKAGFVTGKRSRK